MPESVYNVLAVIGATASGKTRLGVRLAREWGGEIVSADSRQVYRGLNVGSGKDLDEYRTGGPTVAVHLVDVADLQAEYSVFDYQQDCFRVIQALWTRGMMPIVVGGSGLYLEAVFSKYRMVAVPENGELRAELNALSSEQLEQRLRGLRPTLHNTTDLSDRNRTIRAIEIAEFTATHEPAAAPDIRPLILGIRWPREELRARIRSRLEERMQQGLVEEVESLMADGVAPEKLDFLGLEYRFVLQFLEGQIKNRNDLKQKLAAAIDQFARKQEKWFRRMERNGANIHWIDRADFDIAREIVSRAITNGSTV